MTTTIGVLDGMSVSSTGVKSSPLSNTTIRRGWHSSWSGTDSVPPSFKRRKVLNHGLRGELNVDETSYLL